MRLIGTLQNENDARKIASYLKRKGIDNHCDVSFDAQTGFMLYQIWVIDEDKLFEAARDFQTFSEVPSNPQFDLPAVEPPPTPPPPTEAVALPRTLRTPFTNFILVLCVSIFAINFFEERPLTPFTPIQEALLYDLPPPVEAFERITETYKIPPDATPESIAPQVQQEMEQLQKLPYWKGAYAWALFKLQGNDTSLIEGPLFIKIREGQVWRLISPVILHQEFLHILFNMLWVWILCRPIEQRIGITRLFLLSLLCGIGSNTLQYLMSGPFFIGYSGVVMGLAGFTWMRERIAPWEGYPLNRGTTLFLLLFVGGMLLLQVVSFLLRIFTSLHFEPNIANTAHIAGAIFGALLGRFSFFAERIKR